VTVTRSRTIISILRIDIRVVCASKRMGERGGAVADLKKKKEDELAEILRIPRSRSTLPPGLVSSSATRSSVSPSITT